ncbi:TIGR04063 family PEP-CTERM/XrtA system glycosyltransferase [Novosphingopyxis sp. YJ-S2-01]|uniref:TIGR04063 family PEP-CTERM/XrtA system glycosyltransferase n=1 Tax=Novosphingopyxis sp. YJ-S2-01 TaxID=2794021 RepID=UPI0018DDCF0F|nr:TIGR04063 family PEP-CTERM/XrtA system glycosyltransferase [Novosphingopyxis sp. YJ-S2-01]MBH9536988.1 glycosyltransferase, exosortase A system-associated [Novosphingopyxis sp. YJ-S2-01]
MARILHVLDHSLPLHSGYTFRTRAIMKAQERAGWQVAGLTGLRHGANGGGAGEEAEIHEGLRFYRTPGHTSLPSPMREFREVAMLADRIVQLHRRWPFDIIHAHSPVLDGLAVQRAAQRLGLPFVYELRAFWEDAAVGNGTGTEGNARYRLIKALETRVVRHADAVAVICEGLRSDLIARGIDPQKITVSPNGVDLDLFGTPPRRDAALASRLLLDDGPVIGFIGSFYDYEGIDTLIDALGPLRERVPGTQLLLVGGGPCEQVLRARALGSNASRAIRFVGRVPHEEVERYYSLIDVLVYPRKRMRLTELVTPLKPLEAMAQRRLVAASDVGGHRELIDHGRTGTLFAADDPNALAGAVAKLLRDRESWEARRDTAQAFVRAERDWAANVHRYDPVYHSLLKRPDIGCAA